MLLAAAGDLGIFRYGGDIAKTVQARRLSDGAVLWQRPGIAGSARFSSDDSALALQLGSRVEVVDPATGALRWSLAQADVQAVSATTLLVSRTADHRLERYDLDGTGPVAGPARAGDSASGIAGKLVLDVQGPYTAGTPGLAVLQAATLAPVATLLPTRRIHRVVPVGARLAVTPLGSDGLPTADVIVLAAP